MALQNLPYGFPIVAIQQAAVKDPKLYASLNAMALEINKMIQNIATIFNNNMAILGRIAGSFIAGPTSPASFSISVAAGHLYVLSTTTLTAVAAQTVGPITAPVTHDRIDRVVGDATTGVASVVAGTEAASPTPPAIPAGKFPIAQVRTSPGIDNVASNMFTDERALAVIGN